MTKLQVKLNRLNPQLKITKGRQNQRKLVEKILKVEASIENRNIAIDKIYGTEPLSTIEIQEIQKNYPDLLDALKSHKARDRFDVSKAEIGDVIAFRLNSNSRAKELHKLHPDSTYYQITSIRNGVVRGIPFDKNGILLTSKSQSLKSSYWQDKGDAWIKINFLKLNAA
ncbi:hypothetical protein [uncultured phage]|nr:hypothetical protein [uncultured phage]